MTRLVAAAVSCVVLASCAPGPSPARDVLVVTIDTTRADHLGCYGGEEGVTPVLDALAEEAAVFEQAVAPVPVTLPSHCTMFTGLNPYNHGVRYNVSYVLAEEQVTVAERLAEAGFATGAVASAFPLTARFGLDQGFDDYEDDFDGDDVAEGGQPERLAGPSVDRAIEWWKSAAGERRFLWLHLYDPHWVYAPPFPFSSRFERRPYAGEIAYMDREIGRLFTVLRERNEWEEALVVVAGDHGEALYEHGERWHGNLVYEGAMRVPLLVKPPGGGPAHRVSRPVGLVDLAPTVLDYAGVKIPAGLDGVSLREAVRDGTAEERPIYFESLSDNVNFGWSPLMGVRQGPIKYFRGAREELYDLEVDPGEFDNLVEEEPEQARRMAARLDEFLEDADEGAALASREVLDETTLGRLASLGYVGTMATEPGASREVHPPDMVDLSQELLRAQGLLASGKWAEASEVLDFVLSRDPQNHFALFHRARGYLREGNMDEAITLAEALRQLNPRSPQSADLLGHVLSRAGRHEEAARVYSEALEDRPGDRRLRFHRILVLTEAGRLEEATEEAVRFEEQRRDHPSSALARSIVEAASGRPDHALDHLARAVDLGLDSLDDVETSPWFQEARKSDRYKELREAVDAAKAG